MNKRKLFPRDSLILFDFNEINFKKKKLYTSIKQLVVQSQVSYINFKEPINYSRLSDEKDLIIFFDALTLYI